MSERLLNESLTDFLSYIAHSQGLLASWDFTNLPLLLNKGVLNYIANHCDVLLPRDRVVSSMDVFRYVYFKLCNRDSIEMNFEIEAGKLGFIKSDTVSEYFKKLVERQERENIARQGGNVEMQQQEQKQEHQELRIGIGSRILLDISKRMLAAKTGADTQNQTVDNIIQNFGEYMPFKGDYLNVAEIFNNIQEYFLPRSQEPTLQRASSATKRKGPSSSSADLKKPKAQEAGFADETENKEKAQQDDVEMENQNSLPGYDAKKCIQNYKDSIMKILFIKQIRSEVPNPNLSEDNMRQIFGFLAEQKIGGYQPFSVEESGQNQMGGIYNRALAKFNKILQLSEQDLVKVASCLVLSSLLDASGPEVKNNAMQVFTDQLPEEAKVIFQPIAPSASVSSSSAGSMTIRKHML